LALTLFNQSINQFINFYSPGCSKQHKEQRTNTGEQTTKTDKKITALYNILIWSVIFQVRHFSPLLLGPSILGSAFSGDPFIAILSGLLCVL